MFVEVLNVLCEGEVESNNNHNDVIFYCTPKPRCWSSARTSFEYLSTVIRDLPEPGSRFVARMIILSEGCNKSIQ